MGEAIEFLGWPLSVWGVLGTWVASIGTVGAVIVSLQLAFNRNKAKLRIEIECIMREDEPLISLAGCRIRIVNEKDMPVQIAKIGWQTGSRKIVYWNEDDTLATTPEMLTAGQSKRRFLSAAAIYSDDVFPQKHLAEANVDALLENIKPLYVVVCIAAGNQQFNAEVSDNMIKDLINMVRRDGGWKN